MGEWGCADGDELRDFVGGAAHRDSTTEVSIEWAVTGGTVEYVLTLGVVTTFSPPTYHWGGVGQCNYT